LDFGSRTAGITVSVLIFSILVVFEHFGQFCDSSMHHLVGEWALFKKHVLRASSYAAGTGFLPLDCLVELNVWLRIGLGSLNPDESFIHINGKLLRKSCNW